MTTVFNRNLRHRLNGEAGANLAKSFDHQARWNAKLSRIEMHLVSRAAQTVLLDGLSIQFRSGERIHTDSSNKYSQRGADDMATKTGWRISEFPTDPHRLFAVAVLEPGGIIRVEKAKEV